MKKTSSEEEEEEEGERGRNNQWTWNHCDGLRQRRELNAAKSKKQPNSVVLTLVRFIRGHSHQSD